MKKKLIRRLSVIVFGIVCIWSAMGNTALAQTISSANTSAPVVITPFADRIVYYYRTMSDGRLQIRRWNATRNYWVDLYWITVSF